MNLRLVLLIGVGLFGGLILAEVGARLRFPDGIPLELQAAAPDDEIERRPHSGRSAAAQFTYDEGGFRSGSGLPYDRAVLFIGDSFTEGFGVGDDDTFAQATERALRARDLQVRSVNAGNRGFGAAQELKVLRRVLARMRVDAIVVEAFPMNDFSDNLAHGGFGVEGGRLVEYDKPRPPWRAWLAGVIQRSWLRDIQVVRLAVNQLSTGNPPAPYDSPDAFDLERALLDEIFSTARRNGIPIVALVIPTKLVQSSQRQPAPLSPLEKAEVQRFETVRSMLRTAGIPYIDAGEIIPDLAADAAKADGAHFSVEGNARIGEAIARELAPLLSRPEH